MIWNSYFLMTVIDLAIISMSFLSLRMLIRYHRELRQLGDFWPISILILAVIMLGLFYYVDFFIMWVMPFFVDSSVSMAYMKSLHLNWSWITNLIISICIFTGLFKIIHRLLLRAENLEVLNKSLDDELVKRDQLVSELGYQASHDVLTQLIYRREFELRATRLLATSGQDQTEHALCFIDLDNFKRINDSRGHTAGDEVLRQLGKRLPNSVRKRDTLARLGGDEFAVLMEHCTLDQAYRTAEAILQAIRDFEFFWEAEEFHIGASIGLVAITESTASLSELYRQADTACYLAKNNGGNYIHVYEANDAELFAHNAIKP